MSALLSKSASPPRHLVCLDLLRSDAARGGDPSTSNLARGVGNCRRLLSYARTMGWAISHVFDHSVRTRRARAIEALEPLQIEPVLYRTGVSAFSNRVFRESIEAAPDAELVILGLSLSSSYLTTALEARDQGVRVTLVEDALLRSPDALAGIDAIQTLSRSIDAPFLNLARTDDLIDVRRGLRVIS